MTNGLMALMNLKGKGKNGKRGIIDSRIYKVITGKFVLYLLRWFCQYTPIIMGHVTLIVFSLLYEFSAATGIGLNFISAKSLYHY